MKRSLLIIGIAIGALAYSAQAVQPILLRLKLQPGQTLNYSSKTSIAQEVMSMDMSQSVEMNLGIRVEQSPKGMQTVMQASQVKMTLPENLPVQMDEATMQKAMEAVKTTTVYNELGKTIETKVEGSAGLQAMSGAMTATSFGFLGLEYPEKALNIGDTWEAVIDLGKRSPAEGATIKEAKIPIVYKLTKVENGIATVVATIKGKIMMEIANGMEATVDTNSQNEYLIEIATGVPTQMTTKGHNVIDFTMGTMEQKIQATMKKI